MFRLVFKQLISQQINHCCTNSCSPRHLFHEDCERAINNQIIAELNAAYAYLSMAAYFGRTDVALPGCEGFFNAMQVEELQHAQKLIKYQNLRGGKVLLCPLTCSDCTEWGISKSLSVGLEMEKLIKEKLISVHEVAETHNDLNLMDMIVTDFINEQVKYYSNFVFTVNRILRFVFRYKRKDLSANLVDGCRDTEVYKATAAAAVVSTSSSIKKSIKPMSKAIPPVKKRINNNSFKTN
ncbi:PREDICTED: ferritin, heavy subunit-like isoform X1 [Nicrophorus vespilloides]|uniref:Ferritin n=1 Tax=Nicrophorus vespilloides TaxID=110193 RepID=A0ABM1MZG3_NICVS|nr:PREDICTED: ferritin, heavy subunit-like isoform X1 [Nicrophorus vespilloides]